MEGISGPTLRSADNRLIIPLTSLDDDLRHSLSRDTYKLSLLANFAPPQLAWKYTHFSIMIKLAFFAALSLFAWTGKPVAHCLLEGKTADSEACATSATHHLSSRIASRDDPKDSKDYKDLWGDGPTANDTMFSELMFFLHAHNWMGNVLPAQKQH